MGNYDANCNHGRGNYHDGNKMIAKMMITNMLGAILSVIEVAADAPEGNRFVKE